MKQAVQDQIRSFIVENFLYGKPNGFTSSDSLLEKGIIDSTGVLELVTYLEETYGIQVEDDELIPENLDSIENASNFIVRKLSHDTNGTSEGTIKVMFEL